MLTRVLSTLNCNLALDPLIVLLREKSTFYPRCKTVEALRMPFNKAHFAFVKVN